MICCKQHTCPTIGNRSNNKRNTWGGKVCWRTWSNCWGNKKGSKLSMYCNNLVKYTCWGCPQTATALLRCSTPVSISPWASNSSPSCTFNNVHVNNSKSLCCKVKTVPLSGKIAERLHDLSDPAELSIHLCYDFFDSFFCHGASSWIQAPNAFLHRNKCNNSRKEYQLLQPVQGEIFWIWKLTF